MENDLISRSALLEKLKINFSRKPEAQAIYQHLIDIVNDSPIVDTPYDRGYRQGVIDCFTEEWNGDI